MTIFLQYFKISAQGAVKAINPPSSRTIGHRLYATLWAVLLTHGSNAIAAEYSIQPSITTIGSYNDNVELALRDEKDISGYKIIPSATFKYDDQVSQFSLYTEASFDRFSLTRYDTDDQLARLSYLRKFERGSISISALTDHTSARALEDQDTDTGSREEAATRADSHSLSFSGNYSLTEKDTLQGSLSGQQRDYASDDLRGYDYYSANGLWQRVLNQRTRLQARASYSRYIPDNLRGRTFPDELYDLFGRYNVSGQDQEGRLEACLLGGITEVILLNQTDPKTADNSNPCFETVNFETEQNTVDLQIGFVYLLTEKLTLDVLAGASETGGEQDIFFPIDEQIELLTDPQGTIRSIEEGGKYISRSKNHSSSYDLSLNFNGERLTSILAGSRSNDATGEGTLRLSTRAELRNTWELAEHRRVKFDLVWFNRERDNETGSTDIIDEDTFILRGEYYHRFSENWSGNFKYQHRMRSLEDNPADAHRNSVWISLSWKPTEQRWSR